MQTFTVSKPSSTSSLVSATPVTPLTATAWRTSTASNQPQRRLRPVTVPNSCPRSPSLVPTSLSCSLGNGPDPTRVVYALTMPSTKPAPDGPMPLPGPVVPATVFEEVTN